MKRHPYVWDYVCFNFLQVTWPILECVISQSNRDPPFLLKRRGYTTHSSWVTIGVIKRSESRPFIKRVIMVQIQCTRWTPVRDVWQHCGCSQKIKQWALYDDSYTHNGVAKIWTLHHEFNKHDLTTLIRLQAFHMSRRLKINRQIKEPSPRLAYLYFLSFMENIFLDVSINWSFWTSQSLNLLLSSSSRLIFACKECLKWRFCWVRRNNFPLEIWIFVFQDAEWKALIC